MLLLLLQGYQKIMYLVPYYRKWFMTTLEILSHLLGKLDVKHCFILMFFNFILVVVLEYNSILTANYLGKEFISFDDIVFFKQNFQFWNKHHLFVVNNIKFVAVSVRNTFIYLFLPFIAFTSTHTTKPHRFNEHYYGILCATWHQDTMQGLLWELCN